MVVQPVLFYTSNVERLYSADAQTHQLYGASDASRHLFQRFDIDS